MDLSLLFLIVFVLLLLWHEMNFGLPPSPARWPGFSMDGLQCKLGRAGPVRTLDMAWDFEMTHISTWPEYIIWLVFFISQSHFFGSYLPTIILWVLKSDICRQEYWFAVSSLNVEAIHKDSCKQLASDDPSGSLGNKPLKCHQEQKPNQFAVQVGSLARSKF